MISKIYDQLETQKIISIKKEEDKTISIVNNDVKRQKFVPPNCEMFLMFCLLWQSFILWHFVQMKQDTELNKWNSMQMNTMPFHYNLTQKFTMHHLSLQDYLPHVPIRGERILLAMRKGWTTIKRCPWETSFPDIAVVYVWWNLNHGHILMLYKKNPYKLWCFSPKKLSTCTSKTPEDLKEAIEMTQPRMEGNVFALESDKRLSMDSELQNK